MREQFLELSFYDKNRKLIEQANGIIDEYLAAGYSLTLRQLYYQFVARGLLANEQRNYKRLGDVISNARIAGLVDWDALEDRTRFLRQVRNYEDPRDFLQWNVANYAENVWRNQPNYCEVWIEKDALIGVIERPCNRWRVPYFACRGYASQSELYAAGKRLERELDAGKRVYVFHLGDHDPSGMDMTRDNADRLALFARSRGIQLRRLALTMDQIDEYNPPANPAKETDSRHGNYAAQYGDESWELDALEPQVIGELITENVTALLDHTRFDTCLRLEAENRDRLHKIREHWSTFEVFADAL